jgi:hypothetical protein
MERLARIVLALSRKTQHQPGFFVPSFWDKTRDKTLFILSPKMAETLVIFDRPKEPRDRIPSPSSGESGANLPFESVPHEAGVPAKASEGNPRTPYQQRAPIKPKSPGFMALPSM